MGIYGNSSHRLMESVIIQKYKDSTMTSLQDLIKAKETIKKYNESAEFESKLNKEDILKILKNFKYDKSQFCLVYKAALVLQDVVPECNDIDICISQKLHDQLVKDGYKVEKAPLGGPKFTINDRLECFTEDEYNKDSVSCCGYKCKSIKHCLEEYKRRNREKDKATIEAIEKFMDKQ